MLSLLSSNMRTLSIMKCRRSDVVPSVSLKIRTNLLPTSDRSDDLSMPTVVPFEVKSMFRFDKAPGFMSKPVV